MAATDKLVKSIFVFRHGARAPSKPAYDTFSVNEEVKKSWTLENGEVFIDSLTETGKNQCVELGKWIRSHLKENHDLFHSIDSRDLLKWRSSSVQRVKDSGKLFWQGFVGDEELSFEIEDEAYPDVEGDTPAADFVFRTWDSNETYKKWGKALIGSPLFVEKSTSSSNALDSIISTLGLKQFTKYPKPAVLYGMTFAREMVDCERYYAQIESKPLHCTLSQEQLQIIDDLALWCWDQRFFNHDLKEELAEKLLGEIKADMTADDGKHFALYSGHDYTLLVLLAGLGIKSYEELLSFASFVLIKVYEKTDEEGKNQRYFTVTLNSNPFEVDQTPTSAVNEQFNKDLKHPEHDHEHWPVDW